MSRVVPAFQIGQNVHWKRPQIWTAFHVNGRRSRLESACCDSSNLPRNCLWSCRRSRNLWKWFWAKNGRCVVLPQNLFRVWRLITPYPWIFDEAWNYCCSSATLLSRFGPYGHSLVLEVENSIDSRLQTVEEMEEIRYAIIAPFRKTRLLLSTLSCCMYPCDMLDGSRTKCFCGWFKKCIVIPWNKLSCCKKKRLEHH